MKLLKGIFVDSGVFTKLIVVLFVLLLCFSTAIAVMSVFGKWVPISTFVGMHFYQFVSSFFLFFIPPFLLGYLFFPQLRTMFSSVTTLPSWRTALLAVAMMLLGLPFFNWLSCWNQSLSLPESMSAIEEFMRRAEDEAQVLTQRMLDVHTVGGLFFCVLAVAVVPAVCEEWFFRGFLQNVFARRMSRHISVWLTAFVFSFIHFQFFGFFPRMLLGALLGYVYFATGSLWASVLVHFVNNALVVIITILDAWGLMAIDVDTFGTDSVALIVSSAALCLSVMLLIWRRRGNS